MQTGVNKRKSVILLALLSTVSSVLLQPPAAQAASVIATGTTPEICNQSVSDATNVSAVRLAGGDCVITFKAGTIVWDTPRNLRTVRILIVGGGGGGGGSYDTAGAGGGGAGQVIERNGWRINPGASYSMSIGAGGAAGFHIARTNSVDAIGKVGDRSTFEFNNSPLLIAYPGGGGGSSRANAAGTTSRSGGAAATLSAGAIGGGPGGGGYSGGGGGGSAGAGQAGNTTDPARDSATQGGAGTISDITGSSVTYGAGGTGGFQNDSTSIDGVAASTNTGSGGGGASVAGSAFRNGGAGGSGVVVIRYSTTTPTITSLAITGNPTSAIFRANNTITATVNIPATVTFMVGNTRIAGCISIATSGTSPNNVATCSWKPNVKGAATLSAIASPIAAGISGSSNVVLPITVAPRGTRR